MEDKEVFYQMATCAVALGMGVAVAFGRWLGLN